MHSDAATGTRTQTLEGHSSYVTSVAFSRDWTLIASASSDRSVKIWDAATGTCTQTLDVGRTLQDFVQSYRLTSLHGYWYYRSSYAVYLTCGAANNCYANPLSPRLRHKSGWHMDHEELRKLAMAAAGISARTFCHSGIDDRHWLWIRTHCIYDVLSRQVASAPAFWYLDRTDPVSLFLFFSLIACHWKGLGGAVNLYLVNHITQYIREVSSSETFDLMSRNDQGGRRLQVGTRDVPTANRLTSQLGGKGKCDHCQGKRSRSDLLDHW